MSLISVPIASPSAQPAAGPDGFSTWLTDHQALVERTLDQQLPSAQAVPADLHQAIRWAVLGGGKRVRALLVYASGQACHPHADGATQKSLDAAAAAVELVHAYSLIHDDLPCMDNDVLRRGKPTTHVQFGEAVALLAGDAMQPLAFEWLAAMPIAPALVVQTVQCFAQALGSLGMAGGQAIDLAATGFAQSEAQLQQMHQLKTGALLQASVQMGAMIVGAPSHHRAALKTYGQALGLAFQVVDDVLDATADSEQLGKTAGKDQVAHKSTYVSLLGAVRAKEYALELHAKAIEAIVPLGVQAMALRGLADFIVHRSH